VATHCPIMLQLWHIPNNCCTDLWHVCTCVSSFFICLLSWLPLVYLLAFFCVILHTVNVLPGIDCFINDSISFDLLLLCELLSTESWLRDNQRCTQKRTALGSSRKWTNCAWRFLLLCQILYILLAFVHFTCSSTVKCM